MSFSDSDTEVLEKTVNCNNFSEEEEEDEEVSEEITPKLVTKNETIIKDFSIVSKKKKIPSPKKILSDSDDDDDDDDAKGNDDDDEFMPIKIESLKDDILMAQSKGRIGRINNLSKVKTQNLGVKTPAKTREPIHNQELLTSLLRQFREVMKIYVGKVIKNFKLSDDDSKELERHLTNCIYHYESFGSQLKTLKSFTKEMNVCISILNLEKFNFDRATDIDDITKTLVFQKLTEFLCETVNNIQPDKIAINKALVKNPSEKTKKLSLDVTGAKPNSKYPIAVKDGNIEIPLMCPKVFAKMLTTNNLMNVYSQFNLLKVYIYCQYISIIMYYEALNDEKEIVMDSYLPIKWFQREKLLLSNKPKGKTVTQTLIPTSTSLHLADDDE